MAIGPVVTRGYGSFGSVNLVVTRGYAPGEASDVIGKPIRRRRGYTGWRRWLDRTKPEPDARPAEDWRDLLHAAQIELRAAQSDRLIEEIALMERVVSTLMDVIEAKERIEREDEEDIEAILMALH